jgi:hypothetical protein
MKIQVRYSETTKKPVVNYEVFADGLRVGFVKLDKTGEWHAVNWRHAHIGTYSHRREATKAVIVTFQHFAETASKRNLKAFNDHAIRFSGAGSEKPKIS